jgi:hypothetical protein
VCARPPEWQQGGGWWVVGGGVCARACVRVCVRACVRAFAHVCVGQMGGWVGWGAFVQYAPLHQHDLVALQVVFEDEIHCTYSVRSGIQRAKLHRMEAKRMVSWARGNTRSMRGNKGDTQQQCKDGAEDLEQLACQGGRALIDPKQLSLQSQM